MSFLAIIGKRFGDAGLKDVLIDSGVIAEGSLAQIFQGKQYNRGIRVFKLVRDALMRLQIEQFLESLEDSEREQYILTMKSLKESFPDGFQDVAHEKDFQYLLGSFTRHTIQMCESNATYAFWSSFLEMLKILLMFTQATREGNWKLHLHALRLMLPWYFAYGRQNYSRYLPVYLKEMEAVEKDHPDIFNEFMSGNFAVQRIPNAMFSKTACDMVCEQTVNKDTKTQGGMHGFTLDEEAIRRWIASHAPRALLCDALFELATNSNHKPSSHSELTMSRQLRDEEDVLSLVETFNSFESPFKNDSNERIIHISSGLEADEETTLSYLTAKQVGDSASRDFFTTRFVEKSKELFDPIKAPKQKTFLSLVAKPKTKEQLAAKSAKESNKLYSRLILKAESEDKAENKDKKINVLDLMSYNLLSVPPSLGHPDGSMRKSVKSSLIKIFTTFEPSCLEDFSLLTEPFCVLPQPPLSEPSVALIIDGMALVRQYKSSSTVADLARKLLNRLLGLAMQVRATRIDFVIDLYNDKSIKNMERKRRVKNPNVVRLSRKDQKIPSPLSEFLSISSNKVTLLNLLWVEWKSTWAKSDTTLFMCHGDQCESILLLDGNIVTHSIEELQCDHEEADTRLFLHAHHAAKDHSRIVIHSPDTDVLVLGVSLFSSLGSDEAFLFMPTYPTSRLFNLGTLSKALKEPFATAFLGMHAFSGCDSVSSFYGKGKQKFFSLTEESTKWQSFFSAIGSSWDISSDLEALCEEFTVALYHVANDNMYDDIKDMKTLRYHRFQESKDSVLPPNKDSLLLHLQRANYQARIWRLSLFQNCKPPAPENCGWFLPTDHNTLAVEWSRLPIAPEELLEITSCSCSKSACKGNCGCFKGGLRCNFMCRCKNCTNTESAVASTADDEDE